MDSVSWVIQAYLAGRPGSTCAAWSLPEFYACGYRTMFNLVELAPNHCDFTAVGMASAWLPIPNSYPDAGAAKATYRIVLPGAAAFFAAHISTEHAVLVHCARADDRIGLVLTN